jgi:hypothetical protein
MTSPYASVVVRCRRLRDGARRVEVEHVQSGQRVRVQSVAAAPAWIDARWNEEADEGPGRSPGLRDT